MFSPRKQCAECMKLTDCYCADLNVFCCWECKKKIKIKKIKIKKEILEKWKNELNSKLVYLKVEEG